MGKPRWKTLKDQRALSTKSMRDFGMAQQEDGVDQRGAGRVPLPDRKGVVVVAPGLEKVRQLGLKPAILVLKAVGVGAELPQAAYDVLDPGAEHPSG
jgi:hypothetical protein